MSFELTRVLDGTVSQEDVFNVSAKPLVHGFVSDHASSVVLAYGATAAGKTYTVEGTKGSPGLIPRALQEVFSLIRSSPEYMDATVFISLFEVYNEHIYDLLNDETTLKGKPSLKVRENSAGEVVVAGLSENRVLDEKTASELFKKGMASRSRSNTVLNRASSRSHSIFTVKLKRRAYSKMASFSIVDLAGLERNSRTGNSGARLKESVAINSSLMALGHCLQTLRHNQRAEKEQRVIPHRQSKLTYIFRDVFCGWMKMKMIVAASVESSDYDETVHVLKYAATAAGLRCAEASRDHVDDPRDGRYLEDMAEMEEELAELRARLWESEARAAQVEAEVREEVAAEMRELFEVMEAKYKKKLARQNAGDAAQLETQREMETERMQLEVKALKNALEKREEDAQVELDNLKKELIEKERLYEEQKEQAIANLQMEQETLELQLERQREQNAIMQRRLEEALSALDSITQSKALTMEGREAANGVNETSDAVYPAQSDMDRNDEGPVVDEDIHVQTGPIQEEETGPSTLREQAPTAEHAPHRITEARASAHEHAQDHEWEDEIMEQASPEPSVEHQHSGGRVSVAQSNANGVVDSAAMGDQQVDQDEPGRNHDAAEPGDVLPEVQPSASSPVIKRRSSHPPGPIAPEEQPVSSSGPGLMQRSLGVSPDNVQHELYESMETLKRKMDAVEPQGRRSHTKRSRSIQQPQPLSPQPTTSEVIDLTGETPATLRKPSAKGSWLKRGYRAFRDTVFSPRQTRAKSKRVNPSKSTLGKENEQANEQIQKATTAKPTGSSRPVEPTPVARRTRGSFRS
eukprot:scaffold3627_cov350-Prasinococcus_capsulatus_cf.AAC.3